MAPGEHVAPNAPVSRQTLWLSVRLSHENWLFEIEPDEERAIVVGALLRAHVRVNRRDVAPVHFHFEREQDRIRVCPAYGADLCVNGTRISGPHELAGHATIAFAGLELEAYVCDIEPNILEQLDLRDWTAEEHPDCGAVFSLPDDGEITRAIPRLSLPPGRPADATKKYEPLCDAYLQEAGTQRGRVGDNADIGRASTLLPELSIRGSAVVAVGARSANQDCEPTLPGTRPASGARDGGLSRGSSALDDFPSTAPVCSDAEEVIDETPTFLFTQIGLAARERPLAATLLAGIGTALLSLAMLAVDRLAFPDAHGTPSDQRTVASTSLLQPTLQYSTPAPEASLNVPTLQTTEPVIDLAPPPVASAEVRGPKREALPASNAASHARRPTRALATVIEVNHRR